jgi:hypothetical protein
MFANTRLFTQLSSLAALIFALTFSTVRAQDSTLEDIKYKEDYDRVQAILKISDIQKRLDRVVALYKERPDMREDLRAYLDNNIFLKDLETLMKAQNIGLLGTICDKTLKVRPRFGEVYLYQGFAFKSQKKNSEALMAFAKGSVITNQLKAKSKQQLDVLYRAEHGGSLIGEEKLIKEAVKELH